MSTFQHPKSYPPKKHEALGTHQKKTGTALQKPGMLSRKPFGSQKIIPTAPSACQTNTVFSVPVSLLYRPHAYKRDISQLATADFHASSRFFCRDFLGFLFVLPILEPSFFFVAGAACIGNRLYLQRFIFCARSADRDRICALFSTLTPNLSLFTAFSASNGEQPAECLRLFHVILIDVSRETRIFLAIFSINRAVHYSS